jgi:hypothetical protein
MAKSYSKEHRYGSVLLTLPLSVICPASAQLYDLGVRSYTKEISQTLLVDRRTADTAAPPSSSSPRPTVQSLSPLPDTRVLVVCDLWAHRSGIFGFPVVA